MAVPKKRTGHSAQGKRRSNWKATKPTTTKCPNCGAVALAHTVCTACGQYKGKVVSRKAEGFVEATEVKEAKKAPKKSAKKAAEEVKVEEVVETEAVVEEVKPKKEKKNKKAKAEDVVIEATETAEENK